MVKFDLQIVFLLVSDDMHWVKKRIFERTKSKYDIFLAGQGHGEEIHEVGKYFNTFFKTFWNNSLLKLLESCI